MGRIDQIGPSYQEQVFVLLRGADLYLVKGIGAIKKNRSHLKIMPLFFRVIEFGSQLFHFAIAFVQRKAEMQQPVQCQVRILSKAVFLGLVFLAYLLGILEKTFGIISYFMMWLTTGSAP